MYRIECKRAEFLQHKRKKFYTDLIFKIKEQIHIVERNSFY